MHGDERTAPMFTSPVHGLGFQQGLLHRIALLTLFAGTGFAGEIVTFAGSKGQGFAGDGGPTAEVQFHEVNGIVLGPDRALYVCDTKNHRIRRISAEGMVSTLA